MDENHESNYPPDPTTTYADSAPTWVSGLLPRPFKMLKRRLAGDSPVLRGEAAIAGERVNAALLFPP